MFKSKINYTNSIMLIALLFLAVGFASAQTNEFTYQGKLSDNSTPANASYDFIFSLHPDATNVVTLGTVQRLGIPVSNGSFTVSLDFAAANFNGSDRWLEIRVKPAGSADPYTVLTPRQKITSAPYAIRSLNATTADNATNATTANNSLNLSGMAANQFVQTGDSRLSDARNPLSGSGFYIQSNPAIQQTSTSFNISGNGTLGGNLSAGTVNSQTQFFIGGSRVLSVIGTNNIFAGINAGNLSTTGANNSFFGAGAGLTNGMGANNTFVGTSSGLANTGGTDNAFFGANSGDSNLNGNSNSFFGKSAGQANTNASNNSFFGKEAGQSSTGVFNSFFGSNAGIFNTNGTSNAFFGYRAGGTNTTGSHNTMIGTDANVGSSDLEYATALGAGVVVSTSNTVALGRSADTVQVPGNLNVAGTFTGNINGASITNLNASNITTGTLNNARLGIVSITNGGTGSATQNFVDLTTAQIIGGNKFFSATVSGNVISSATQYNIGNAPVLSVFGTDNIIVGSGAGNQTMTGTSNSFFGRTAGAGNTSGSFNSFLGRGAGFFNQTGGGNTFVGYTAGQDNVSGGSNTFIGAFAGQNNTASDNTFVGTSSGLANTGGTDNAFFGANSGDSNTSGTSNSYFGRNAGQANISGNNNSFFGRDAGQANQDAGANSFFGVNAGRANTSGNLNSFVGAEAGVNNTTGNYNAFFGNVAGTTNTIGTNNTAIGFNANVGSNALVNATAIGNNALVSQNNSLVLGSINGVNTATASTNVGIGTTAPEQRLHVVGNEILSTGSDSGFKFRDRGSVSATDDWVWYSSSNIARLFRAGSGDLLTVTTSGVVSINSLGSAGNTSLCRNASNQISTCSSSLRYKTNIAPFSSGLSFINQLRPISYKWKDGGMKDVGFGAEDVARINPLFVNYNAAGEVEGVKYDRLSVVFVNAFKEQQTQIEQQQQQIKQQQIVIDGLRKLVCQTNTQAAICQEKMR